ncbi:hypothetical protein [Pseudonocardia sp. ICBG162]|uniref:hypothetical protein n=1 Tax=Pseudonocardia sp. ICBG162 TaxID=2846761 RepID=UPI001CF71032|nr:hypothetical protein [Pseudonocardia sp. ICBG162]
MSTNDVVKGFLLWLLREDSGPRTFSHPRRYLDTAPEVDGQPVTEDQLIHAIERAESHEMIKIDGGFAGPLDQTVRLLPPGRECAEEGGDLAAFLAARRGPVGTTTTVTVHARDGVNVVGTGRDVAQANRIEITNDPERLRIAADAIDEVLPLYPRVQNRAEIESAVQVARESADSDDEPARASAGARLVTAITTLAGVSTVGRVVVDLLTASGVLG